MSKSVRHSNKIHIQATQNARKDGKSGGTSVKPTNVLRTGWVAICRVRAWPFGQLGIGENHSLAATSLLLGRVDVRGPASGGGETVNTEVFRVKYSTVGISRFSLDLDFTWCGLAVSRLAADTRPVADPGARCPPRVSQNGAASPLTTRLIIDVT